MIESPINTINGVTNNLVVSLVVVADGNQVIEVVSVGIDGLGGVGDTNAEGSDVGVDCIDWSQHDSGELVS